MLSPKNALSIFIYVNVVSWLLLLVIKLISFLGFGSHQESYNFYLKGLLLNLFFLVVFFYFNTQPEKKNKINFVEIFTQLFVLGLITNTLSLLIQFILSILEYPPVSAQKAGMINTLYHCNIALLTIFISNAFFKWKRLILNDKNPQTQKLWNIFEYLLLISLIFNFFEFDFSHIPFSIAFGLLLLTGLTLSMNLKWVAYLNAKEKWQSILLLLFICLFSFYFFRTVISHSYNPFFTTDLMHSVYMLAMFVFVIFYSIFSLLVILFNLPTTSVVERKIGEVESFQKLTQSLQIGEKEEEVYEALLDSAVNSVNADAAWLEINDENGSAIALINRDILPESIDQIKRILKRNRLNKIVAETFPGEANAYPEEEIYAEIDYDSILVTPLVSNEKSLGNLTLLKRNRDGFDDEKKELVNTFARQASISIENFRLLAKTLETERYKEEIKIASNIQKKLLPNQLHFNESFEVAAYSESAYEVGGDYYDTFKIDDTQVFFIIADVSGKGTLAAFNMAQMKGVFQSLSLMNLSTRDFLHFANQALIRCLEKTYFITATLVLIDTETKKVEFTRAGHCPTLYYSKKDNEVVFYKGKGLGLGILRNKEYNRHLETQSLKYNKGDILLLYTDGFVEAKNLEGEDYGYEHLESLVMTNTAKSAEALLEEVIKDFTQFVKNTAISDDRTALLIKFLL